MEAHRVGRVVGCRTAQIARAKAGPTARYPAKCSQARCAERAHENAVVPPPTAANDHSLRERDVTARRARTTLRRRPRRPDRDARPTMHTARRGLAVIEAAQNVMRWVSSNNVR